MKRNRRIFRSKAAYLMTLKQGFHCTTDADGRLCVVTPYLYPDHDFIELFVKDKGEFVVVSDLGETLRQLDTLGMDVCNTPKLKYAAERIAAGVKVEIQGGVIVKRGRAAEVGNLLFDVLSAVKLVSSLIYGNRAYEPIGFDFTRLTDAHSKKLANHEAMLGLFIAYYNYCRPHQTLNERNGRKTTPAMEAGITDHVWAVAELLNTVARP